MTRDPLLPVRLVDGVWTTEGAGSDAVPTTDAPPSTGARNFPCDPYPPPPWAKVVSITADQSTDATEHHPGIMALGRGAEWPCSVTLPPRPATDYARAFAEYNPPPRSEAEIAVTMDADEARRVAEHVLTHGQRTIFAVLHPCGYLYALGDTEADARENALSRRDINRDEARSVGVDFPPPETDVVWADELIFVTVSGTTESLRIYVASVDDVIPWCPADLWDSGDVAP